MVKIRKYGWLIKIISAALLLAIALYLKFSGQQGEDIVNVFIGIAIILFAMIRLVPITKTEKNDIFKMINIVEITINIIIGALLIVLVLIDQPIGALFGYLLGGVLFVRGSIHFYGVSANLEDSDLVSYISNILFIALGTYMITTGNITPTILINIILGVSILGGGYLGFDGGKGYKAYRYQKVNARETKDLDIDAPRPEKGESPSVIIQDEIEEEEREQPSIN